MNIVIPAAGAGSRFVTAGYSVPKPFLPIKGKPMVEWVIDNMAPLDAKVYVLLRTCDLHYLQGSSLAYKPGVSFIPVDRPTEGAACTVLLARQFIDNEDRLVIVNSDQYIKYDREFWFRSVERFDVDGWIMTFNSDDPKWSYAEVEKGTGRVTRVAEKEVISDLATCGTYAFGSGMEFCDAADRMIEKNIRVKGEFYLCPVFNELCGYGNVQIFPVSEMYGLGTPEDFRANEGVVGT